MSLFCLLVGASRCFNGPQVTIPHFHISLPLSIILSWLFSSSNPSLSTLSSSAHTLSLTDLLSRALKK